MMELGYVATHSREPVVPAPGAGSVPHDFVTELREAIEAREVLERILVRLAALRRTDADVDRLWRAVRRMEDARFDRQALIGSDIEFHVAVSRAAHNHELAARLWMLRDRVEQLIVLFVDAACDTSAGVDSLVDVHARLVDAIDRGDADTASRIISAMMERLREEMSATYLDLIYPRTPPRLAG